MQSGCLDIVFGPKDNVSGGAEGRGEGEPAYKAVTVRLEEKLRKDSKRRFRLFVRCEFSGKTSQQMESVSRRAKVGRVPFEFSKHHLVQTKLPEAGPPRPTQGPKGEMQIRSASHVVRVENATDNRVEQMEELLQEGDERGAWHIGGEPSIVRNPDADPPKQGEGVDTEGRAVAGVVEGWEDGGDAGFQAGRLTEGERLGSLEGEGFADITGERRILGP